MIVQRLIAAFGYEQVIICDHNHEVEQANTAGGEFPKHPTTGQPYVRRHSAPRDWMQALEDELIRLSRKPGDNKTAYVFETREGTIVCVSFWDSRASWIEWHMGAHPWVPGNLTILRRDVARWNTNRRSMELGDIILT